jgi:hypothetical protein
MASIKSIACAAFALLPVAHAHFNLNTPTSAGFNDDEEGTSPCGAATLDFAKQTVSDFHVGGQPVGMLSTHTQTNWLFRATLDKTGSGNWTQLFPILQQSGTGKFCEKAIPAPESWVGKEGLLGVVANGPDGLLYQVSQALPQKHSQSILCLPRSDNGFTCTVRACQLRVGYERQLHKL